MPEKSKSDSANAGNDQSAGNRQEPKEGYLTISREEMERELRAEKGDKWMEEHKAMLDSQWEYIDSL